MDRLSVSARWRPGTPAVLDAEARRQANNREGGLQMVLDVACRDSQLTVAGRKWVEEFSLRLERYFPDILTVHWDLTMEGNHHVATCRLHSRQGFYRASARDMDARLAMHTALDKLTRQRHREKRALGKRRRESSTADVPALFVAPSAGRSVHSRR